MSADLDTKGRQIIKRKLRTFSAWELRRAARTVAHHSNDAEDCRELLDMLGLTVEDGLDS